MKETSAHADIESSLRLLIEKNADAILIIDSAGIVRYINPAAVEMFGRPREQLIGHEFGFPAVAGERSEIEILHAGGELRSAEMRVAETTWQGKEARVATLRDVTDRRRAEQRLRESEERYRLLADNATDLISRHDPQGRFLYACPAAAMILGYTPEQLLERSIFELVHPDDLPAVHALFAAASDEPRTISYAARRHSGEYVWLETTVRRFHDSHDAPLSSIAVSRDISERKELEQQLRHAQKMEAVGRLAGGVAHDFNNLLTAITGYSQMAMSHLAPGDAARMDVEQIRRAADRATALTRQLLSFSRKHVLQARVVSLNDVIRQLHPMMQSLIGEHVQLLLELDDHVGLVRVDPTQIEQVIVNLIVNARDAMPHGGRITLRTAATRLHIPQDGSAASAAGEREFVLLTVSDTGVGIDPQHHAHIFEPFFTTKTPDKGTGLGLSTVYGIVQQSGGRITFESAPYRGTTFRVYLPVAVKEAQPANGLGEDSPAAEMPRHQPPQKPCTILVVEDLPVVRSLVQRILRRVGYNVIEATDTHEALRILQQPEHGPIDLLITDVVMPETNGPELAARAQTFRPGIKVLFMSGYTAGVMHELTGVAPGERFLQKPFTAEELCEKVRQVVAEIAADGSAGSAPGDGRAGTPEPAPPRAPLAPPPTDQPWLSP